MIVAAALCPAPPLLVPALTGGASVLPELRQACAAAVTELLAAGPEVVAVVGPAPETATWEPALRLDLAAFAPGLPGAAGDQPALPTSLGVGAFLLDQGGYTGERLLQSAGDHEPPALCAKAGTDLAALGQRTALLVLGDGSACRGPRAPGHFDPRSATFDAEVERAVREADLAALLALDAGVARELMAAGRPAWQVMSGALNGSRLTTQIRYSDDPFGVAYLVASLRVS
jgi:hypothetical protein